MFCLFKKYCRTSCIGISLILCSGLLSADQKVVLVTGASNGIGLETARLLASSPDKYKVYGTYHRNPLNSEDAQGVTYLQLDQADSGAIDMLVSKIIDREKRLDVLVNNAGIGVYGPLEALSAGSIEKQFQVNLIGPVLLMRAVLPEMRINRYGRIINVSSIAGAIAFPFMDVYSGSKFGLEGTCAALEGYIGRMDDGADIHCRVVEPGYTHTDFRRTAITPEILPEIYRDLWQRFDRTITKGLQTGQPVEEVAAVIRDTIESTSPSPFRMQTKDTRQAFMRDVQGAEYTGDSMVIKIPLDKLYPGQQ